VTHWEGSFPGEASPKNVPHKEKGQALITSRLIVEASRLSQEGWQRLAPFPSHSPSEHVHPTFRTLKCHIVPDVGNWEKNEYISTIKGEKNQEVRLRKAQTPEAYRQ
jgi:hypothetical protein